MQPCKFVCHVCLARVFEVGARVKTQAGTPPMSNTPQCSGSCSLQNHPGYLLLIFYSFFNWRLTLKLDYITFVVGNLRFSRGIIMSRLHVIKQFRKSQCDAQTRIPCFEGTEASCLRSDSGSHILKFSVLQKHFKMRAIVRHFTHSCWHQITQSSETGGGGGQSRKEWRGERGRCFPPPVSYRITLSSPVPPFNTLPAPVSSAPPSFWSLGISAASTPQHHEIQTPIMMSLKFSHISIHPELREQSPWQSISCSPWPNLTFLSLMT